MISSIFGLKNEEKFKTRNQKIKIFKEKFRDINFSQKRNRKV